MRLDCYIRVSDLRGRDGDRFISPDVQRDACERWAQQHHATIVRHWPELDVSGGSVDRPMLRQVLERIDQGVTDGIIVARQDRFSRSLAGGLEAIERIRVAGGVFVSVAEGFDLSTPEGRLMLHHMLVLAQYERERITVSWQVAQDRALERGVHICAGAPIGYLRAESGVLVPGPEAWVVVQIFERRAHGVGWGEICRWLDDAGIAPARAVAWRRNSLVAIVRNRVYLGEAQRRGVVRVDAHPPIVTPELWAGANQVRGVRQVRRYDMDGGLVAGVARCAGCRLTLRRQPLTQGGRRLLTYECRTGGKGGCPAPTAITARLLDEHVARLVDEHLAVSRFRPAGDDLAQLAHEAEAAARTYEEWRDDPVLQRELGHHDYSAGLFARKRARDHAVTMLDAAHVHESPMVRAGLTLADLPEDVVRRYVHEVIYAVFLRRAPGRGPVQDTAARVLVVWAGERPDLVLPSPGRRLRFDPVVW